MRKRRLEMLLSSIPPHPHPKLELEQYATPSHLASRMLWVAAATYRDLGGEVLDLGAGTGRLGLGAALLDASYVLLVDIDLEALRIARQYGLLLGVDDRVDVVCADVTRFALSRKIHCVLQNPPFGVHRRGADVEFLRVALSMADVVYSVHKSETVDYLKSKLEKSGALVELLFKETVRLPPTMPHHRKRAHQVEVAVLRVRKRQKGSNTFLKRQRSGESGE